MADSIEEAFPEDGWVLVVFDIGTDGTCSIIGNVSPNDICDELSGLVESMKEEGHGRKH